MVPVVEKRQGPRPIRASVSGIPRSPEGFLVALRGGSVASGGYLDDADPTQRSSPRSSGNSCSCSSDEESLYVAVAGELVRAAVLFMAVQVPGQQRSSWPEGHRALWFP